MRRSVSFIIIVSLLVFTLASCNVRYSDVPGVISLSSSASQYGEWVIDNLKYSPDKLILGIGTNDKYGIDMLYFEDDGYIIKRIGDSVVIFGKTEEGLSLACEKYVKDINTLGYTNDTVHNELSEEFIKYASSAALKTGDNILTLAFKTDSHHSPGKGTSAFIDFANIQKYIPIDLYVHGGDLINGDHITEEVALDTLSEAIKSMSIPCSVPFVGLKGNHDDNSWFYSLNSGQKNGVYPEDGIISADQWREIAFTNSSNIVTDDNGNYGYMDHESSKIRILFIDTSDVPYNADSDGYYYYGAINGHAIRNEQLNFMANAMTFSDKGEDACNWAILIMSHVPIETMKNIDSEYRFGCLDAVGRNFYAFLRIVEAYKNGTHIVDSQKNTTNYGDGGYSKTDINGDFSYNIDVDFSVNGPGEVIGFICGHTHIDNYSNEVGKDSYRGGNPNIYPELSLGYAYISIGSLGFATISVKRNGDGSGTIYVDKNGMSVVSGNAGIKDTDNAFVTFDPVALNIVSSVTDTGSVASGKYSVNYSQHR